MSVIQLQVQLMLINILENINQIKSKCFSMVGKLYYVMLPIPLNEV